jgi:hypothetical protein
MNKILIILGLFISLGLPSFAVTRKEVKKLVGETVTITYLLPTNQYTGRLVSLFDMDYPKEKVWYLILLDYNGLVRAFELNYITKITKE